MMQLYLASSSPRRQQLLTQLGYAFRLLTPALDETPLPAETAAELVVRLAQAKAQTGWQQLAAVPARQALVLGADTVVVVDGTILGKPRHEADASQALQRLSGRAHQVFTAIAVTDGHTIKHQLVATEVHFCALSAAQIQAYWQTGEPADKAGSYAIQGLGGNFVERINGSYSAVVGLPLVQTRQLIDSFLGQQ